MFKMAIQKVCEKLKDAGEDIEGLDIGNQTDLVALFVCYARKVVSIEMSSAMVEFALNLTRENRSTVEVIEVREVLFIGYFSIYLRLQIYLISHYRLFLTYLKSIIRKLYH